MSNFHTCKVFVKFKLISPSAEVPKNTCHNTQDSLYILIGFQKMQIPATVKGNRQIPYPCIDIDPF